MTFTEWLSKYRKKDSPLGDLADDVARDLSFPADPQDLEALLGHLRSRRASQEALQTASDAWKRYLRAKRSARAK